jgi:hypothetical protein
MNNIEITQNQLQNILIGEKFISSVDSFGVVNTKFYLEACGIWE